MKTIYKDGKPIITCIQFDETNIKEVADFLQENEINWHGKRGGPYTVDLHYGSRELNKTDWLLKRQNDFVIMSDKNFNDTYKDMVILRPLNTDFTNMGNVLPDASQTVKYDTPVQPINIPSNHIYKQVGSLIKSQPILSREDEFVMAALSLVKCDKLVFTISRIETTARELMQISDKLKAENNHE